MTVLEIRGRGMVRKHPGYHHLGPGAEAWVPTEIQLHTCLVVTQQRRQEGAVEITQAMIRPENPGFSSKHMIVNALSNLYLHYSFPQKEKKHDGRSVSYNLSSLELKPR